MPNLVAEIQGVNDTTAEQNEDRYWAGRSRDCKPTGQSQNTFLPIPNVIPTQIPLGVHV